MVMWITPLDANESKDGVHLHFLETGLMGTPELATVEARRGLHVMLGVCKDMLQKLQQVIGNPDKKLGNLVDEIKKEEQRTDEMEEEIIEFCSQLARTGTSLQVAKEVASNLEMTNDIERIGDHCMNLVLLAERRWEKKYKFSDRTQDILKEMLSAVGEFMELTVESLAPDGQVDMGEAKVLENKINKLRNQSRKAHAQRMQDGEVGIREGLIFLDMMTNLEKIGDYLMNVCKDLRYSAE
jgi:phosphate:Na+ symporter